MGETSDGSGIAGCAHLSVPVSEFLLFEAQLGNLQHLVDEETEARD